jgi:hypothetical protein
MGSDIEKSGKMEKEKRKKSGEISPLSLAVP